ncbi:hypothetical protein F8388_006872 [Cannabis sativa]|uniref:RNase H type-1 domain-containing protein n=1 Tax=Cannabis sativa TaxID=3483 RepID=A0A7J6GVG5_CANSA|nr:hypothetical protein F8388_006872 [Cannabis sativa]KAF4397993.1 hypothetical protein G4B88_019714 [Cannabis sativa]
MSCKFSTSLLKQIRVGQNIYTQESISALEAEFKAIHLALTWAVELGWHEVHVFSDAKVAVQSLNARKGTLDWKFDELEGDFRLYFMNSSFDLR